MRVREEKEVGEREKDVRGSEGGRREREVRERKSEREREWKEIFAGNGSLSTKRRIFGTFEEFQTVVLISNK